MKTTLALITLMTLVSCGKGPAGKDGINGLDGINGKDGIQGEKGDKGDPGKDGLTKMVKFCPGLVDKYSIQYSEHGLCVDGKVYAIYSDKGLAALVEIVPGLYQTTTPKGTNCTFEVKDNCITELK